jgi:hypothetical protein
MQKLNFNKKKAIGTFVDGSTVYDYGSKFFVITSNDELLLKKPRKFPNLDDVEYVECDRYEYVKNIQYTNDYTYNLNCILDIDNIYVKGNKIDFESETINDLKYIYCSSVDYVNFYDDEDDEDLKVLEVVKRIFNDNSLTLDDLNILDSDENKWYSFVIVNNSVAVFEDGVNGYEINTFSLNDTDFTNNSFFENLAYCVVLAEEKIKFDKLSLLTFDKIENIEKLTYSQKLLDLKLEDVTLISIAKKLNMNYKSLSASKKKEMYFSLYKIKLLEEIL